MGQTSSTSGRASRGVRPSTTASPEGHYLQFGQDGSLIAVTLVNARWILEQEGKITITLPERRLEATDLGDVLAAA